ncbi:MAG: hypothetical protein ACI8WT_004288 [Clostridium sp.]|jgi:hypothetical protein
MPKVEVSFKSKSKDMKLYLAVMAEEEKSIFVKNALEFYINHLENNKKEA